MKSKIGIVICGLMGEKQFVSDAYIKAVKSAGGLPIILPLVKSNEVIADYVKLCSGFLFCGGGDITPLLFGEEPARGIGETDIALDLFQIRLMKSILKSKKPVLAICRGMQILNVACHGTICQDIELRKEPSINHMQTSISRKDISHKVNTVAGSRLHRIIGEFAYTNSFHHQVIVLAVIMALAAVIGAPKIRNKTCLALPFLFLMLHVSYGTGTVIGLIKMPFWAKGIKNGRN